jgi:hypothetical protein
VLECCASNMVEFDCHLPYHTREKSLFETLLDAADFCSERGIRFEDCLGRTAEEAKWWKGLGSANP